MSASSKSSEALNSVTPSAPTATRQTSATTSAARTRRPSLSTGHQAVAQSVHVLDRVVAARLSEFPSQDVHVAAQGVARLLLVAPYRGFEILSAVHPVGLRHHGFEEADALGWQLDFLAAEMDQETARIQRQVARRQRP